MTNRGPLLASLTIASFVVLFSYSLFQLNMINHEFHSDRGESNLWAATQAEREAQALLLVLHDTEKGAANVDDVRLRFDILYSRVDLLADRPQLQYFRSIGVAPRIAAIMAEMTAMDEVLFASDADPAAIADETEHVISMLANLRQISFTTALEDRTDRYDRRQRQISMMRLLMLGALGAFLSGVGMAALLWRNMNRAIRIQAELEQHRDSLETTIATRTRELRDALNVERQTKEVYKSFIVTVAHQFRTPVSIIHMIAQRQLRAEDGSISDKLKTKFQRIFDAAVRLERILNGFLSSAHDEGKNIALSRRRVDLKHLVDGAVEQMRLAHPDRQIDVKTCGAPVETDADPVLLEQVFLNLMSNAVKYSSPPTPVTVTLLKDGDAISCSIADEGIGIPGAAAASIYEPYFRATNVHHIPGIGVGLNLAREIIDMHGGSIDCKSEEGKGSRFTVILHASKGDLDDPGAGLSNDPLRGGRTVPSR